MILNVVYLSSIIALFLAFGVFGQVSTWIAGTSKGLLAVGKAGYLPPALQKLNNKGFKVNILLIQAGIVTIHACMFVLLPSVQSAYQIISTMCVTLYLIMYILLFLSFIKLRISQPTVTRDFKVPGGHFGMILVGGVGLLACVTAFFFGFIPPTQISVGSSFNWVIILIIGNVAGVLIPLIMYKIKKDSWKSKNEEDSFEPFSWELKEH